MKQFIHLALLIGISASSLVSCVSGLPYAEAKKAGAFSPKPSKGLVLIYCPGGFTGKAANIRVWVDDEKLPEPYLRRGGFYTYDAQPGSLSFSNEPPKIKGYIAKSILSGAVAGTVAGGPIGTAAGAIGAGVGATIRTVFGPKRKETILHVSAGQVYYMNAWGRYVRHVSKEEADEDGFEECLWLNPTGTASQ